MHPAVNNGVSGYLRVDDEVLQADALPTADADDDAIPRVVVAVACLHQIEATMAGTENTLSPKTLEGTQYISMQEVRKPATTRRRSRLAAAE